MRRLPSCDRCLFAGGMNVGDITAACCRSRQRHPQRTAARDWCPGRLGLRTPWARSSGGSQRTQGRPKTDAMKAVGPPLLVGPSDARECSRPGDEGASVRSCNGRQVVRAGPPSEPDGDRADDAEAQATGGGPVRQRHVGPRRGDGKVDWRRGWCLRRTLRSVLGCRCAATTPAASVRLVHPPCVARQPRRS